MSSWTEPAVAFSAAEEAPAAAIFAGDTGALPVETRRVITQLLVGPSLDGQRHTKLWPVLVRDERAIRSRLHELFLELVIDFDQQVAFTRQVAADDVDLPILLRKAMLTFIQSALILYLRERLIQAETRGERAVLSREEMTEHLAAFDDDSNRDQARFTRQASAAVERAKELSLLRKLRGSDERYEVSPTLKLLFRAEEIQALTQVYVRLSDCARASTDHRDSASAEEEP